MRNLGGVGIISTVGMLLILGNPVSGRGEASKFTVHAAPESQVITVTVTDLVRTKHVPPIPITRASLDQAGEMLGALRQGKVVGRVVLVVSVTHEHAGVPAPLTTWQRS